MITKKITITSGKVSGTHTDFPVYLKPSAMTGWTTLTTAEAESMRAYSDVGLTTELAIEVVSNDEIHIKVPSLTSSSEIYVTYDGIRSLYAFTDTYGRNAVWSDYTVVWHMNNLTATTVADSTGNWDGTKTSSGNPLEVDGRIGKAQNITSDYVVTGASATLNITGVKTAQTWVNFDNLSLARNIVGIASGINSGTQDAALNLNDGGTANKVNFYQFDGIAQRRADTIKTVTTGVWYMFHGTYDGTNIRMYQDSVLQSTVASGNSFSHGSNARIHVGRSSQSPSHISDEVRYRASALSANWITTEYNNQNDVATFWDVVEVGGGGGNNQAGYQVWL